MVTRGGVVSMCYCNNNNNVDYRYVYVRVQPTCTRIKEEMRLQLALLRSASEAGVAVAGKRRPLRWRVLGGTAVLCAAFAGYHYWKADPTQRRRLRVGAEGVVRFLR